MSRKIAAIPPVTGVQDRVARDALQALADGWQVRNGLTGTGDDAFLTASDVVALIKKELASKSAPGMIESRAASITRNAAPSVQQPQTTAADLYVQHPTEGTISLEQWIAEHTSYTIDFEGYIFGQLDAIKARLAAGNL